MKPPFLAIFLLPIKSYIHKMKPPFLAIFLLPIKSYIHKMKPPFLATFLLPIKSYIHKMKPPFLAIFLLPIKSYIHKLHTQCKQIFVLPRHTVYIWNMIKPMLFLHNTFVRTVTVAQLCCEYSTLTPGGEWLARSWAMAACMLCW